jgi:hypothetical protein
MSTCQRVNPGTTGTSRWIGEGSVQVKESEATVNLNDDNHDLRFPFAGPILERDKNRLDPRYCSSNNRDSTW